MMTRSIRICLGVLMLCACLAASGCVGPIDIEDVGLILALGIDAGDEGGIKLWFQVALPGAGIESLSRQETLLTMVEGDTLYDALMKAETRSAMQLTLGHVRVIVIGEKLARRGLQEILDPLARDATLRFKSWVLVTSDPVEDVIGLSIGGQPAGMYISDLMQREAQRAGAPDSRFIDLTIDMEEKGVEALLARIALIKQDASVGGGAPSSQPGSGTGAASGATAEKVTRLPEFYELDGAAVFRDDKMVGWLNTRQSAAAVLVKSGIRNYEFVHWLAPGGRESVAVNLMTAHSSTSIPGECLADPALVPGCTIDMDVTGLWGMRELISKEQYTTDESTDKLSRSISTRLQRDIHDMLRVVQTELKSDVIGMGELFRQRMAHSDWRQISSDWNTLFESLDFEVTVAVKARRRGQSLRSPGPDIPM